MTPDGFGVGEFSHHSMSTIFTLNTVINRTVEQFNVSQHRIRNSKGLREKDKGRMKGTGKLEKIRRGG